MTKFKSSVVVLPSYMRVNDEVAQHLRCQLSWCQAELQAPVVNNSTALRGSTVSLVSDSSGAARVERSLGTLFAVVNRISKCHWKVDRRAVLAG